MICKSDSKNRMIDDSQSNATALHRAALHDEGYAAAFRGLERKDNPYPVPSFESVVWERGWANFRKKRSRKKRSRRG